MNLSPLPIQKFFSNAGRPLVGGKLFTYVSGTATKIATYKNAAGTLNTNPVRLDFRGECRLWIDPTLSYTFVLSPATDTDPPTDPIWTVDDITAGPAQQDNAAVDTGSVNNIELSIPQISSPVAFTRIVFKAANTNTGPVTISINGGTAQDLTWQSAVDLIGYEIVAGGIYQAIYDGAQWQLQGPTLSPGDIRFFGATGDGVTSDVAAISAADATGVHLYVRRGTYLIDSNVTLTSNYEFERGAVFKIATGVTLFFTQPATEKWAEPRQIFQIVGTGKVQWTATGSGLGASPTVYPEWWQTNTTPGATDMTAAIQAAADCVVNGADAYCPSKTTGGAGRCTVKFTRKAYLASTALDFNQRDYLELVGAGSETIYSNSTTYIADFSSCFRARVSKLNFVSTTAGVGFLFNRCTSNPYCLYNNFSDVTLNVGTNTGLNSGQGSYGIVNCRAEQNVWSNCDIRADVPRYLTQTTNPNFPPVSGTQDTTIVSLVVSTFNQCNFLRHTKHNYGNIIDGAVKWADNDCYYATVGAGGSVDYMFNMAGVSGFIVAGLMEGTKGFMFFASTCYFGKINLTPQAVALDSTGLFSFDSATNTGLVNAEITCNITSAITSGKVIRYGGGSSSCQLFNIRLITGDPALITGYSVSPTNCSAVGLRLETNELVAPTVASTATLAFDIGQEAVFVSGTTNITSVSAFGHARKTVTLIFQGVLTFTNGSNLKLSANFVTTADASITLYCDGSNWIEVSRSAN